MKYVIHRLVTPQSIQRTEVISMSKIVTKVIAMEILNLHGINSIHNTMDEAVEEIGKHSSVLKGMNLTIIPVIWVDENGKVN
jgi:hypothetical protein